ncbi:MAG: hypothetical protein Kow0069_21890 [Promethearchaeota archaeon]
MKIEKSSPDLQAEVIFAGLCMHCGACGAYCSHIEYDETGRPVNVDACNEVVGLCYNSCPRAYLDLHEQDERTFGKVRENELLGVVLKVLEVKGAKPEEIIAALVKGALSAGQVEVFVMPSEGSKKPANNVPVLVKDGADAAKHAPSRGNQAVGPLIPGIQAAHLQGAKKIGFVGNPCHFQAIKRQARSNFATPSDKVALGIALMCAAGGLDSCKMCVDYAGEFADVSIGPNGVVLVRSEAGLAALEASGLKFSEGTAAKVEESSAKKKARNLFNQLGSRKATVGYLRLSAEELKRLVSL